MRRDNRLCGVHLGGCGRELTSRKEATRDHMVPQSFIAFMPPDRKREFNDDWNVQPACRKCNNELKGGQVSGWPVYRCRCHYLQLGDDGGMYIHERTRSRERRHLLTENVIGDDGAFQVFPARLPKHPNERNEWRGYSLGRGGHLLATITEKSIPAFNWFELVRIGEAKGPLSLVKDGGKACTFLPNGRIVPGSRHWCARVFPRAAGHLNVFGYDPFTPADTDEMPGAP